MKITRIRVFQTDLPYVDGGYCWGAGNVIEVARASVVVVETDAGVSGCGEFTPCGENYMVAHSAGVPALARLVAPRLIGQDPRDVARIEALMDDIVQGHLDFILEQPCRTYEECQQVRRVAHHPMKLDECVTGMAAAQRIVADRGAELVCLKISNLGGLSKARRVRDYLVAHRFPVVAEDSWGGEIATAALSHFAATTPPEYLHNTTDLMNYNTRSTGVGGAVAQGGKLFAPDAPGLGVAPDFDSLGDPVAVYGNAP